MTEVPCHIFRSTEQIISGIVIQNLNFFPYSCNVLLITLSPVSLKGIILVPKFSPVLNIIRNEGVSLDSLVERLKKIRVMCFIAIEPLLRIEDLPSSEQSVNIAVLYQLKTQILRGRQQTNDA